MIAFSGLLFDLDGTLLDTAPDFVTSVNSLLDRYKRAHLDFDLDGYDHVDDEDDDQKKINQKEKKK